MIQLFSHYVPGRLVALAVLEALVLLMAVYVGISLDLAGSGTAISEAAGAAPSQAGAFALGMMIVMSSMGLYQPDRWHNAPSISARLVIAFFVGFVVLFFGSAITNYLLSWARGVYKPSGKTFSFL